jgi:calmodulin
MCGMWKAHVGYASLEFAKHTLAVQSACFDGRDYCLPRLFAMSKKPQMSAEELAEFREIFDLVDKDKGGSISREELGELMDTLGIRASKEEIDLIINEIDEDNNGEIDFEEFVAVMSRKVNANYTAQQVKKAFKAFEAPGHTGYCTMESLRKALMSYGAEKLDLAQANELLSQLEQDSRGLVNYVDYVNMMMGSS